LISSISGVSLTDHPGSGGLNMVVKITNLKAFERRFPKDIAPAIDVELVNRFKDAVDDGSTVIRVGPGCILVVNVLQARASLSRASTYMEDVLRHIAASGGLLSLAVLDVRIAHTNGQLGAKALRIPASEGRMHLCHAGQVLNSIVAGNLAFSCQSVFNINDMEQSLYDECLSRVIHPESNCIMMPSSFIPSIERSGFVNQFDQIVVSYVVDRLISDNELVLGCNISAESATESHWWAGIFERLQRMPDVARRLIIEITETAPIVPGRGRSFARRLQALGCRIAIDDLGAGYGVQNGIEIGEPDIVKLDVSLLKSAKNGYAGVERLRGFAELAHDMAPTVVVEGVESSVDLEIVRRAGCEWAQGSLIDGADEIVLPRLFPLPPS
jgi:EAL domain-containing protein (putative c-di-GMP-specific phosphodiesterase class I)